MEDILNKVREIYGYCDVYRGHWLYDEMISLGGYLFIAISDDEYILLNHEYAGYNDGGGMNLGVDMEICQSKDINKILSVLRAIKECEDE